MGVCVSACECVYVLCLHVRGRVCICEHVLVCVCSCVVVSDVWACVSVWAVGLCGLLWAVCVCVWLCGLCLCVAVWLRVDGSISLELWDEDPTVAVVANVRLQTSI
jgi:hypothetical protein